MALKYPERDENGKAICQLCGKSFEIISATHLKKHNIPYEKYKKLYPEAALCSTKRIVRTQNNFNDTFVNDVLSDQEEETFSDDEIGIPIDKEIDDMGLFKNNEIDEIDPEYEYVHPEKVNILKFLKRLYPQLENNYAVEQRNYEDTIIFNYITDIADPITKVIFDFPNAFWHNSDKKQLSVKKRHFAQTGWRVITIPNAHPTTKDLMEELDIMGDEY